MRSLVFLAALFILLSAFAADPSKPFTLAGAWRGGGFVIVLQNDGSGTLQDSPQSPAEPMRWKAAAGKLTITQAGQSVAYDYRVQSGALKLSGGDLDQPVSLTRAASSADPAPADLAPTDPAQPSARSAPKAAAAPKPGSPLKTADTRSCHPPRGQAI